jgi:hypothetical protein
VHGDGPLPTIAVSQVFALPDWQRGSSAADPDPPAAFLDWSNYAEQMIALRRAGNTPSLTQRLRGKALMDHWREIRGQFISKEERLLQRRTVARRKD